MEMLIIELEKISILASATFVIWLGYKLILNYPKRAFIIRIAKLVKCRIPLISLIFFTFGFYSIISSQRYLLHHYDKMDNAQNNYKQNTLDLNLKIELRGKLEKIEPFIAQEKQEEYRTILNSYLK